MVYAVKTSLNTDVDNQLSIIHDKQQSIESTQNLAKNTQPEYFQPMETSTPEPQHLSNNEINEVGTLDKQNEDESGLDDDEDDEESKNNSVMSNTERSNINQSS